MMFYSRNQHYFPKDAWAFQGVMYIDIFAFEFSTFEPKKPQEFPNLHKYHPLSISHTKTKLKVTNGSNETS